MWHGRKPFTAYRDQFPRFMSEFGFQSLPPFKTVKTYASVGEITKVLVGVFGRFREPVRF